MDFVVLPEIRQAVQTYADQLVYGYTYASEELIKEVQKWEATQHGYHFDKEALVFIEGCGTSHLNSYSSLYKRRRSGSD